jgi:hypothetical protein
MPYFNETEDKYQRVGHVIGGAFALLAYIGIALLMVTHFS